MPDLPKAPPHATRRRRCVLTCLSTLLLGAGQATAMSPGEGEGLPSVQVAQATQAGEKARTGQQPQGDAQAASAGLADLNAVLAATQKRLEELFKASAALAERREAFEALEQENERLAAALREANTARADLESASKLAESRIAELTKATEAAVRDSGRIDKELADLREQLARAGQELARAQSAREQAVARASELERSQGNAERVRAELAAVKEQLSQAASTAFEAERSRQTTSAEAEQLRGELAHAQQELVAAKSEAERGRQTASAATERLRGELARAQQDLAAAKSEAERGRQTASAATERLRGELARAQQDLAAAKSEVKSFSTTNATLMEQVNSLRADSQSAMEAARRNLVVMEERIEQLNTALAGAGLGAIAPASAPQASPVAKPYEAVIADRTPSANSEAIETGGAAPDADNEVAAVAAATASSPNESSELAKFNANIAYLNRRALDAAGADLFSGIEAAGDGVVNVSTTPAWAKIPVAGQRSYLNSLLDLWIVAQEGSGPAVVRIVDPNGRVLLEKSGAVQNLPRVTE